MNQPITRKGEIVQDPPFVTKLFNTTIAAWLWLALSGVLGTVGQVLWTRALKLGEVSALTPISFVQLPIVTLAGWLLFAERVDGGTLIGAAIILSATFYIARREARLARQAASQAPSEAAKPGE